jgi:hypothetical protein
MSTYAKIEHSLYDNPKIVGLSCEAFRAYVEGILYSGKNLTDGFLDERIVSRMWGAAIAEELTTNDPTNPSWQRVDGGWLIYGFCERQNSKADVDALREQKSRAGKASVEAKRNRKLTELQQSVEHTDNTSSTQAQPDTDTDTNTDTDKSFPEAKERETKLSSSWTPTSQHYELAKTSNIDILREVEMFRLHAETYDRRATRWNAAFTTWLKKSKPSMSLANNVNDWMKSEPIVLP